MPATFEQHGLKFMYPENWSLEQRETDASWEVTIQSPETAFMVISAYPDKPSVESVLDTTLQTMQQEYPELDQEEAVEEIANETASGHNISFFSLDFINSCWTRCFQTEENTILILCQVPDSELAKMEPVFRAIRASIQQTSSVDY